MNLFTRLPISVDDPTLPVLDFADVQYLVEYEPEAYGHWIFDKGDSSALASVSSDKVLTQQGASIYSDKFLSMSNSAGNALVTDIADKANPADTYCMVVRNPNITTARMLLGIMAAESGKGWGLFVGPSGTLHSRHYTGSDYDSTVPCALNAWMFVAIARNQPGSTRIHYVGGQAPVTQAAGLYTPTAADVPVRLGNGYYSSSTNSAAIDYAEFIAFDTALGIADLDVLYARTKARMAARGITVI